MTSPPLRFPEFVDSWREATAGDAFSNSKAKGEAGLPIWSVTLDRGMVPRDSLDRHLESDAADERNLRAQPGDLVYNMMRMWQGAVGQATEECMVSPAYVVLSPKEGISSSFFDYWFNAPRMLHRLRAYSHGLTKDRLRLYYADFAKIPISLPSDAEQTKIAAFLQSTTQKADMLRWEKKALEQFKLGLMQKIFSQAVRYTRESGRSFPDWEEYSFGDIFGWVKTNSLSREHLTSDATSGIQNIHYGDIHSKFAAIFRQSIADAPYISQHAPIREFKEHEYLRNGDVVIADASEDRTDVGKAVEILEVRERSIVGGLHTLVARPSSDMIFPGFAGYLLRSEPMRRQIERVAQGISVLGISKSSLDKLTFWLPHYDEQEAISSALMAVDEKIIMVASEINEMEGFQQGLLQEMFV